MLVTILFAIAIAVMLFSVVGVGAWAAITQGRGKGGLMARSQVGLPANVGTTIQFVATVLIAAPLYLMFAEAGQARDGVIVAGICFGLFAAVQVIFGNGFTKLPAAAQWLLAGAIVAIVVLG